MPITYKGFILGNPLRIDLLVDDTVIIEIKAVAELNPVCFSQVITYLRLSKIKLGMLINFGEKLVKDGIHRVVNNL